MTSPRKGGGGGGSPFDGGEPFVTLSGPDSICVRATFTTPGYNQTQNWARSGNQCFVYTTCMYTKHTLLYRGFSTYTCTCTM